MLLAKASGGCTITWQGKQWTWKDDGAVVDVPRELGDDLLSIRGAGFSEAPGEPEAITEPRPAARKAVTEPAPAAKAAVTEGKTAKS